MTEKSNKNLLTLLSAPLPKEAIQRASKLETKKGYDTTGFGYQYCVNRLNEVCGKDWGFSWQVIKEIEGVFRSGQKYFEIIVLTSIWVEEKENQRSCVGGHLSASYADALKGAITNSFKKTAAFWGVGAEAYEGSIDDDNVPQKEGIMDIQASSFKEQKDKEEENKEEESKETEEKRKKIQESQKSSSSPKSEEEAISPKQRARLFAILNNCGYDKTDLKRFLAKEKISRITRENYNEICEAIEKGFLVKEQRNIEEEIKGKIKKIRIELEELNPLIYSGEWFFERVIAKGFDSIEDMDLQTSENFLKELMIFKQEEQKEMSVAF